MQASDQTCKRGDIEVTHLLSIGSSSKVHAGPVITAQNRVMELSMTTRVAGTLLKALLAAMFGLTLAGTAVAQTLFNPIGIWEPDNRESRYAFSYCGENNQRLCAELIWIREDVQDARNTKYLNTYMFKDARHVQPNLWRGTVTLEGFNIGGTVTQSSDNTMQLDACVLFVICENIRLNRVQ